MNTLLNQKKFQLTKNIKAQHKKGETDMVLFKVINSSKMTNDKKEKMIKVFFAYFAIFCWFLIM